MVTYMLTGAHLVSQTHSHGHRCITIHTHTPTRMHTQGYKHIMHGSTHARFHTHRDTHIHTHSYGHTWLHRHTQGHKHSFTYMHRHLTDTLIYTHSYVHTDTRKHIDIIIYTQLHLYTHMHALTCKHTHTLACVDLEPGSRQESAKHPYLYCQQMPLLSLLPPGVPSMGARWISSSIPSNTVFLWLLLHYSSPCHHAKKARQEAEV